MKIFLITYDLVRPGQRYEELYQHIKDFGEWQHPLESTWFVKVSQEIVADGIYEQLKPFIDQNDHIFVTAIDKRLSQGWMQKSFWEWLSQA